MLKVRPNPCAFCPYRRDVPSGVWAEEEYNILRNYDLETFSQPFGIFKCHDGECLCGGWARVHGKKPGHDLIALRLYEAQHGCVDIPDTEVPLFASGAEAADHGVRDIENPSDEAIQAIKTLKRKLTRKVQAGLTVP